MTAASSPGNWHTRLSQLWRNRVQNCGFLLIGFGARGTKRDPVHGPPRPREPAGGGSEGCNRPNSAVIVSACRRQRCPPRCHPTDSRPAWPCGTPLQLRRANGWAIPYFGKNKIVLRAGLRHSALPPRSPLWRSCSWATLVFRCRRPSPTPCRFGRLTTRPGGRLRSRLAAPLRGEHHGRLRTARPTSNARPAAIRPIDPGSGVDVSPGEYERVPSIAKLV